MMDTRMYLRFREDTVDLLVSKGYKVNNLKGTISMYTIINFYYYSKVE
jgi:hypothetical protein